MRLNSHAIPQVGCREHCLPPAGAPSGISAAAALPFAAHAAPPAVSHDYYPPQAFAHLKRDDCAYARSTSVAVAAPQADLT